MANPLLPDPEQIATAFAEGQSAITDICGSRIGTELAAGTEPSIRITTVGGDVPQTYEGTPILEFECWGGTREEASDLARALVSVVPDIVGPHPDATPPGFVSYYDITLGPFSRPDPISHRPRFIVDVQMFTHPYTP